MDERQDVLVLECKTTDLDVVLRFIAWFFAVFVCGWAFFAQNILYVYYIAVPFALFSVLHKIFKKSYKVTVTAEYIEKRCLYLYCRKKEWSKARAYRLKHTEGEYRIDTSRYGDTSGYVEEEYTILLYFDKGLPMRISNSLTNYKRFKKLLKERGVKRLKPKKKK